MINPLNTKMELSVRATHTFFLAFEKQYGKSELTKLIDGTGMSLDYFDDENNWISYDYFCHVLDKIVDISGDPNYAYKLGLTAAKSNSWGLIKLIITTFVSCTYTYKKVISLSPRWAKSGKFNFLKIKKNKATLEYKLREDLKQYKNNCLSIQGQLASIPTYYNLPPAKIRELQCAADGADSCIYEISWKNPPYKKMGFYFFLAGIAFSILLYYLYRHSFISLSFIHALVFIIIPAAGYSIWKLINDKETIKDNYKKIEQQNEVLTKHLEEIEKLNEILQNKVEEKTNELLASNDDLRMKITDLKNNEDELIRSGKMSIIGKISEEVADKLKKPLNKVHKILADVTGKTHEDTIKSSLTGAQRAADRCEKTLNELLSFSHIGNNLSVHGVDVNKLIEECANKANEQISNPDIKICTKFTNDLPIISADYKQIEQIIMIFITNANDAINEALKNSNKKEGEISIQTSFQDNNILIEIKDTGSGIPNEVIKKIFDPFFSTKSTSKRKGMGLTLSYNYIKQLGGKIDVKSDEGKGTTFTIAFPVTENNNTFIK
ncbi:MAG: HAMP domain-containing histidine kinase [Spirochaetes bacterium]|nr:HAMP domain-containing histidine kinase [Spirochaetota bacterium]